MHKIMPNMQAAHSSDIQMYSQMSTYHVLGNKILPFNEKGISLVKKINNNHISSNIFSKQPVYCFIFPFFLDVFLCPVTDRVALGTIPVLFRIMYICSRMCMVCAPIIYIFSSYEIAQLA